MTNLTGKEQRALSMIAIQGLEAMGGETPRDLHGDNMSWFDAGDLRRGLGVSAQAAGGIMSSLDEKGMIFDGGEGAWYLSGPGIDKAEALYRLAPRSEPDPWENALQSKPKADWKTTEEIDAERFPVQSITNTLIEGDPMSPSDTDIILQRGRLPVGQPIPEGWRVLTGNVETSDAVWVGYRFEAVQ